MYIPIKLHLLGSIYSVAWVLTLLHARGIRELSPYNDSNLSMFGPLTKIWTPVKLEYKSCLNWSFPSTALKSLSITVVDFPETSENSSVVSGSFEFKVKFTGNLAFTKVNPSSVSKQREMLFDEINSSIYSL